MIAPPATVQQSDGKSRCSLPLQTVMAVATGTRVVSARDMDSLAQDDIEETFRSMCHFIPWTHFIEDLINHVLSFRSWTKSVPFLEGLPAGPQVLGANERPMFRMSLGSQTGAAASAKAAPPLVPFNLGPDGPCPTERGSARPNPKRSR